MYSKAEALYLNANGHKWVHIYACDILNGLVFSSRTQGDMFYLHGNELMGLVAVKPYMACRSLTLNVTKCQAHRHKFYQVSAKKNTLYNRSTNTFKSNEKKNKKTCTCICVYKIKDHILLYMKVLYLTMNRYNNKCPIKG